MPPDETPPTQSIFTASRSTVSSALATAMAEDPNWEAINEADPFVPSASLSWLETLLREYKRLQQAFEQWWGRFKDWINNLIAPWIGAEAFCDLLEAFCVADSSMAWGE